MTSWMDTPDENYELIYEADLTPEMRRLGEEGYFAYRLAFIAGRTLKSPFEQLSFEDVKAEASR